MTAPEADLTGWSAQPFTGGGYTHDVYRRGDGPGVVLIPEIPGIHPGAPSTGAPTGVRCAARDGAVQGRHGAWTT